MSGVILLILHPETAGFPDFCLSTGHLYKLQSVNHGVWVMFPLIMFYELLTFGTVSKWSSMGYDLDWHSEYWSKVGSEHAYCTTYCCCIRPVQVLGL